jgi:hypothetical protein
MMEFVLTVPRNLHYLNSRMGIVEDKVSVRREVECGYNPVHVAAGRRTAPVRHPGFVEMTSYYWHHQRFRRNKRLCQFYVNTKLISGYCVDDTIILANNIKRRYKMKPESYRTSIHKTGSRLTPLQHPFNFDPYRSDRDPIFCTLEAGWSLYNNNRINMKAGAQTVSDYNRQCSVTSRLLESAEWMLERRTQFPSILQGDIA